MKSAAVREARQVARIHAPGWYATGVKPEEIAARLRIPQEIRSAYDRLNHRERGRARARWRGMVAAARPDLTTRRDTRGARRFLNECGVPGTGRTMLAIRTAAFLETGRTSYGATP